MYDTVNMFIDCDGMDKSHLETVLQQPKYKVDAATNEVSITGKFGNYFVFAGDRGITLQGSLSKLYFDGENQSTLTRATTKEALQLLEDNLHLPVSDAYIRRLDIGFNLPVKQNENAYYPFLGTAKYYQRLEQNNGIYYQNNQRQMLFYGKVNEQQQKKTAILPIFTNANLLRYELRYLNRLTKQLNEAEIKAARLTDEDFYLQMLERWKDEYFTIYRHRLLSFKPEIMNSTKEFELQLMALGLQALGGEGNALAIIEQAKKENVFENKMQQKRLKDKIKSLCSKEICTMQNDLITELDKKIKEAVKYYR